MHFATCEFFAGIECGYSSVVERQLPKLNVVGSSPITRLNMRGIGIAWFQRLPDI